MLRLAFCLVSMMYVHLLGQLFPGKALAFVSRYYCLLITGVVEGR